IPGLEAVMGEIGQVSSGSKAADLGGGLGKVLVPGVMKATHEAWGKMIVKLQAKLKTAITRRNGLKKALDRLGRIRGKLRNPRLIQWHQQQIAALNQTISDIRNAIGEAMAAQNDLATAAAAQVKEDGEEQDRVDAQTARDTASANEAADASFQAGLVNMPADARLEMARAAGTADTSDDMAGLQAEKSRLEGNLGQGNMESEIGIVNALNSVNSQIARLIADAKTAADAADRLTEEAKKAADAAYQAGLLNMPVEARLAAARAGGTADNADDLALIREEKARLEAGLGKGSIETEIGIVNALNGLNNQLAQAAAAAASAEAGLLNMPSSLRLAMARAAGPGDELGLLRSERDRIESLSRSNTDEAELGYLNALKNVNGQIAQAAQAISAAALSMPVGLRLAAARAGGTADPADDLAVLRDELARLLTVGRSGEEGEIAYLNAVNGLKGQIEQGEKAAKALIDQAEQAAKQAAEAADSAYQVGLLNMPAAARLAMARAAGTVDKADDLALLRGEKTRLEAGLGKGSIETEISVVNALNSVDGQIAQLLEEAKRIAESTGTLVDIEKNREGFLQALRALRSDASNIYDPLSSLSGRTLQVQNFYSQPPPDSHMWSKQLEFELKALVG
ncbi:MAG TPA: hypothetical protein VNI55_06550, partial [Gaiellaceae bacterium]|nr:hypothetical protein [Gaiellaceae bacterium]